MHRVVFDNVGLETKHFARLPHTLRRALFVLFLLCFAFVWAGLLAGVWLPNVPFHDADWPDAVLLLLAAAALVASLTRELPGQNVILASVIIAVLAGAILTLGACKGVPFGSFTFTQRVGSRFFDTLPWTIPVLWLAALLASRGVARLILRPWRKASAYGFWVLGLSSLLMVLFDLGLEPYAASVKSYWTWGKTAIPATWYGAPIVNFLGWSMTALLILALATPSLINKKPVKVSPDSRPLVVWLLMNLFFLTAACARHLWLAAAVTASGNVAAGLLAWRGARVENPKSEGRNPKEGRDPKADGPHSSANFANSRE